MSFIETIKARLLLERQDSGFMVRAILDRAGEKDGRIGVSVVGFRIDQELRANYQGVPTPALVSLPLLDADFSIPHGSRDAMKAYVEPSVQGMMQRIQQEFPHAPKIEEDPGFGEIEETPEEAQTAMAF